MQRFRSSCPDCFVLISDTAQLTSLCGSAPNVIRQRVPFTKQQQWKPFLVRNMCETQRDIHVDMYTLCILPGGLICCEKSHQRQKYEERRVNDKSRWKSEDDNSLHLSIGSPWKLMWRDRVYRGSWSRSSHFPLHLFHRWLSSRLTHFLWRPQWSEGKRDIWIHQECTENLKYVWSGPGEWLVVGWTGIMIWWYVCVCVHMGIRGKLTCCLFDALFLTRATWAMHPLLPTYNSPTPRANILSDCNVSSIFKDNTISFLYPLYCRYTNTHTRACLTLGPPSEQSKAARGHRSASRVEAHFLVACVSTWSVIRSPSKPLRLQPRMNVHPRQLPAIIAVIGLYNPQHMWWKNILTTVAGGKKQLGQGWMSKE